MDRVVQLHGVVEWLSLSLSLSLSFSEHRLQLRLNKELANDPLFLLRVFCAGQRNEEADRLLVDR